MIAFEDLVVNRDRERERVGQFVRILLLLEVEEPGVVFLVRVPEELAEPRIDPLAFEQFVERLVLLDAAILADTQEEEPVDGPLHDAVQFFNREPGIAERDILRKVVPP